MSKIASRPCVLCSAPIPPARAWHYLCSPACDEAARVKMGGGHVPTARFGLEAARIRERAIGPR